MRVLQIGHELFYILTIWLHPWQRQRCLHGSTTVSFTMVKQMTHSLCDSSVRLAAVLSFPKISFSSNMVLLYYITIKVNKWTHKNELDWWFTPAETVTYEEFFFDKLVSKWAVGFQCERSICELDRLFRSPLVTLREDCFSSNYDGVVIISESGQVLCLVLAQVQPAYTLWELLLKSWWELKCVRSTIFLDVCVETK